ncbi:MAG: redoxin family protein [Porticoccus sp.]|nr:redoxin family protein [Porticoccus sp.]MBQ0806663.1 redoxin family protein [Porticoccus sp.]
MSNNVPNVTFKIRVRGESVGGKNPFLWKDVSTEDIFPGKSIIIFALPAVFTQTCSSTHLPGYDAKYDELKSLGIDEVYCLGVNSPFTVNQWAKNLGIKNVKMLPDAHADFTRLMGMLVKKENGNTTWRYSAYVVNGEIKKIFSEAGMMDDCSGDPFECSDVDTMIAHLKK